MTDTAPSRRKRVTITDIASAAGVSKGAASYALNGRPGVSAATRERVLAVARQLEWIPNPAARVLSGRRAGAVGLVVTRPPELLGSEPFFMELLAGLESVLSVRSVALLLQVAPSADHELAILKAWSASGQVDGVVLIDLREADPRVALLTQLSLPAVAVGAPEVAGALPCVWTDDRAAMRQAVRYLARLGHRRIARVAGPPELAHITARGITFAETLVQLRTSGTAMEQAQTVDTDLTGERGAAATRRLLTLDPPPTAIVYDNDLCAVAGLMVTEELGLRVPQDVSLLAWDDSQLCLITRPTLSAMSRDVHQVGRRAAALLLDVLDDAPPRQVPGPPVDLLVRGSTGPPPPGR
ncbi:LacI family DNA-binding transcriptional regulator [Nakamurella endophytica]|uniref:LacI family transcriptional regulator n=1 Tax=Nakamurella endophytica TaxID=1748367 RepID=A0A917SSU8_9ACTN|nr:LacI family DNA-binding transcriptional regulator [Nakamurella endophytica]GGL94471.1 LacI family transcriptional regulator [Nakamurella endophytica]